MRISINYPKFNVSAELNLEPGARIALYGPSGSGKTSILRAVAGLIAGCDEPLKRSEICYMHQEAALFAHMSVLQNLQTAARRGFGAELKAAIFGEQISEFHENLLQTAGLWHLQHAKISELSGGQKQRAALCAALAGGGKYLLLDEPFSALDDESKRALIELIKSLCERYNLALLLISHSAAEVCALAKRVHLVQEGKISKILGIDEFSSEFLHRF